MTNLRLYRPASADAVGDFHSRSPVDPKRCACGVWSNEKFSRYSQCGGKALHTAVIEGETVKVCGVHSPAALAKRKAAQEEKAKREKRGFDLRWKRPVDYTEALLKIANGHNDPRALAREVLTKWGALKEPTE